MSTKAKALKVAARFGFVLDETVSGKVGDNFSVTFDHPTHSIEYDCRSICVSDYGNAHTSAAVCAWSEAIERMEHEGQFLELCTDPDCEYHTEYGE
jgi:hypothetical protein